MSVCPHGKTRLPLDGFSWNLIYEYFPKICPEKHVSLISNKNNMYFTWRSAKFMIISRSIRLKMRNVSDKVVEKIKSPISCAINLFFENRAIYKTMWKNTVEPGRPQMTKRRMCIACWTRNATDTLRASNNFCVSTSTMVTRTRLNVTSCLHCRPCSTCSIRFYMEEICVFVQKMGVKNSNVPILPVEHTWASN
jgi:hypothetical protein